MRVRNAHVPLYAAGLALIMAAAVTGCAAKSSSATGTGGSSAPAQVTPLEAVKLAAHTSRNATSFTGTMSMQLTVKPGAASAAGDAGSMNLTATFAERLHPSLLARVDFTSWTVQGASMPGGMSGMAEIVTPTAIYLKWPYLTQMAHLTKPWLDVPLSAFAKSSGVNISQLMNQATGNSPLAQTQMMAAATSVREVGTGTIDGTPVTEYTGTIPLDKALAYLTGSTKIAMEQQLAAKDLSHERFTVWIDGQHVTRKAVVTLTGKSISETVTMTITSLNKPVDVAVPSAGQTSPLPAGALG
ncbi:MAG: hypothetical protein ACRDNS_20520 [Trebonia sp.]